MYRGIRLPAMATTVLAVFALSGCGGGSDGGGSPSVKGGRLSPGDEIQDARARAAGAIPRKGSVTQSSNIGGDGVTEDVVEVVLTPNGDKSFDIKVMYNGEEAVDTDDATVKKGVEYVLDRPKGTQFMERFGHGDDFQAVEFYRSLDTDDLTDVAPGDLWVDVYTDFDGNDIDDTNYLAGGIWVYIPDDGEADDYEFGAFADGAAPYPEAKIAGLEGTAAYTGGATGVYSYGTNGGRRNEFFDATVELMADFGTSDAGSISGRIHEVEVDGEMVDSDPELMLGDATLNANSNFFTGDTTMTFDGENYAGKWGGQFYNDPETGTDTADIPGAVAGTFGGANEGGDKSFVGVFGAYHTPPAN